MEIKEILDKYREEINGELRKFFGTKIRIAGKISSSALELMENLKEFTLRGGKRIRPMLLIFGYKSVGGRNERKIVKAALAVELMESFLLIHDDIIDEDETRRGGLTMHMIYEGVSRKSYPCVESRKFGRDMALIAGDVLAVLGSEVILNSEFPYELRVKAADKFNKVVINTCFGQLLDMLSETSPDIKEEDILKIHILKTAIYTVEGPLHIGAILGNADSTQLKILSKYAIPLGQAFQIQDDILGMFGKEEATGKPVGSDLREGKNTLLIVKALEKANREDKEKVLNCIGNRLLQLKAIEEVRSIIVKTGSLNYSRNLAKGLVEKAKLALANEDLSNEGKEFLLRLADYVISREK